MIMLSNEHDVHKNHDEFPTLFMPLGDNDSATCAVSEVGEWLLDSNWQKAKCVSKEVLD